MSPVNLKHTPRLMLTARAKAKARENPIVTPTPKADEVRNEQVNNIEAIRSTTTFSHLPNYCTNKVLVCEDDLGQ